MFFLSQPRPQTIKRPSGKLYRLTCDAHTVITFHKTHSLCELFVVVFVVFILSRHLHNCKYLQRFGVKSFYLSRFRDEFDVEQRFLSIPHGWRCLRKPSSDITFHKSQSLCEVFVVVFCCVCIVPRLLVDCKYLQHFGVRKCRLCEVTTICGKHRGRKWDFVPSLLLFARICGIL